MVSMCTRDAAGSLHGHIRSQSQLMIEWVCLHPFLSDFYETNILFLSSEIFFLPFISCLTVSVLLSTPLSNRLRLPRASAVEINHLSCSALGKFSRN